MWPLVVLYALVANAAVVPANRQDRRFLGGLLDPILGSGSSQDSVYLQQAIDAEAQRNPGWQAMGCRKDTPTRALSAIYVAWSNMTLPICMNECFTRGYTYGGVQFGTECWVR